MCRPVNAPGAPLGAGDFTRRWALATPAGPRFAGLTRPEADVAGARLREVPDLTGVLVAVTLDAMLTDGAGPHLLDAEGRVVIALGPHPALDGVSVAMGPSGGGRRVGVVADEGDGVWRWRAVADVDEQQAVVALDALAAVTHTAGLEAWAASPAEG